MIQFLALFSLVLVSSTTLQWLPKTIWTYWESQISINSTLYLFHQNHLYYSEGWQVVLLNDKNVLSYLQKVASDKIINQIIHSQETIKKTYIKILLLKHYGGVWIEYLALMTQKMNWIELNRLLENKNVLTPGSKQIECLLFSLFENTKDENQSQINFNYDNSYQNFQSYKLQFLACKPNSLFVNDMDRIFKERFLQKVFLKDIQISSLLYNQLPEKRLDEEKNSFFGDKNSVKLQKQSSYLSIDNIWSIKAQDGPLGLFSVISDYQIYYALRFVLYFTQRIGKDNRYFIKFCLRDFQILEKFLQTPSLGLNFEQIMAMLNEEKNFEIINNIFCPQRFSIHRGSIIYNHLLKNNKRSFIWSNISKDTLEPFDSKCAQMKKFFQILKERIVSLDRKLTDKQKTFLESIFNLTEAQINTQNKQTQFEIKVEEQKKRSEQKLKLTLQINHQIDKIEKEELQILSRLYDLENQIQKSLISLQQLNKKKVFFGIFFMFGMIILMMLIFICKRKQENKIVEVPQEQQNTSQQEKQLQ